MEVSDKNLAVILMTLTLSYIEYITDKITTFSTEHDYMNLNEVAVSSSSTTTQMHRISLSLLSMNLINK